MFGTLSKEIEVNVPASEAWNLYGTLKLADLVRESLSHVVSKVDVVQGNGGVGTIIELFFRTGPETVMAYKEKFTVVDEEKLLKETEVVEGGFLDLGFTLYRVRLEIKENEGKKDQCITKSTIEYEVKEEAAANASLVSIDALAAVMQAAKDHLEKNYNNSNSTN